MGTHSIEVIILGTAQDGGIPHFGCDCLHCQAAWRDESLRRLVASLGIIDHEAEEFWLIDASPDIREQLHLLATSYPGYRLAGVVLTHAHVGHYLGLAFFGRESLNTRNLPVLCTKRMAHFLQTNQPWKQLIDLGNIVLSTIEPGHLVQLGLTATATPILVPHRDELSDTVAWSIAGPTKKLIYCPDVNHWKGEILEAIAAANVALLDGTFYSADELPHRDISDIPHPLITDSMTVFADWDTEIRFIHLNHTNRLLSDKELVLQLGVRGLGLGKRGDCLPL